MTVGLEEIGWTQLLEKAWEEGEDFDAAWAQLERRVRNLCSQLTLSRSGISDADREDMAQDLILKLQSPKLMSRLMKLSSVEGYFVAMIKNMANDLSRKRRVLKRSIYYGDRPPFSEPTQEVRLQDEEMLDLLRRRLSNLKEEERELLEMRFVKEMSIGEMAAETGKSYSAVAVRIFRLLHRLRRDLRASRYLQ